MIIFKYVVSKLTDAVSGISNEGIEYDEYTFTLAYSRSFDSKNDAVDYIEETLIDYKNRGIKNERFIINEVYFLNNDKIFTQI